MKRWIAHNAFILFLCALACAYHGYNLGHREGYRAPLRWGTSTLRVIQGAWEKELPLATPVAASAYTRIDAATARLSDLGSLARYVSGQRRFDMVHGPREPYQELFLREELPFQFSLATESVQGGYLDLLRPLIQALDSAGVKLVLLPVPTKMALRRAQLPATLPNLSAFHPISASRGAENPDAAYRQLVQSDPLHFVDLLSPFREIATRHPGLDLFIPYDSNWTSRGIVAAAEAVLAKLGEQGLFVIPPQRVRAPTGRPDFSDGLVHGLQLPQWYLKSEAAFQWYEPRWTLAPASEKVSRRLFMVGTCYGARFRGTPLGLGEMLAASQGMELHSFAIAGSHGVGALQALWESKEKLRRGDVVVFEFAFRQPWNANEQLKIPHLEIAPQSHRL